MIESDLEYVGFWPRVGAAIIDTVILCAIIYPLLTLVYGWEYWTRTEVVIGPADFLISWVLPAVAWIWLWVARGQTPGKMAIGARIVDAKTGRSISAGKAIIRYVGYMVSMLPLFIGYLWVGFDPRKMGWHDHMAGTVVIRNKHRPPEPVAFSDP